jgi:hypothetical protein
VPAHPLAFLQDIVESDKAFTLQADAPGFDPEDVKIELREGQITISGRKDEDKKQEQDGKVSRTLHPSHCQRCTGCSSGCAALPGVTDGSLTSIYVQAVRPML